MAWTENFDAKRSSQLDRRIDQLPTPAMIAVSQDFGGPDGPWSSFAIQVGTPVQTVKVLISTANDQTWVVLPQGCTPKDPSNCEISRGGFFHSEQSHSWIQNGTFSFGLESNLGYDSRAEYGFDTVALGWQGSDGPSLQHQIIAGIATKDFYLGLFGVNPRPSNFTNYDDMVPSFMSNLKNKSIIPSLTYAYTSGNQYRLNKVFASLTLGGYDASRFIPNNVSFAFDKTDERDLTVNIKSITMTAGKVNTSLMSTNSDIQAFIDSTIPYLYLPSSICKKFEDAFGLTFNNSVQAYLVNDTLHQKLLKQNASVTFALGNSRGNTTETVDISLPYAAFDLIADYPLMPNATRYFPIMRAVNNTQYTLGRTFLQEAYLIADYERFNFSISQNDWSSSSQQPKIVSIKPISSENVENPRHMSTKIIAGAVLGGVLTMLLMFALIHYVYPRIRAQFANELEAEKSELDGVRLEKRTELGNDSLNLELDGMPILDQNSKGADLQLTIRSQS